MKKATIRKWVDEDKEKYFNVEKLKDLTFTQFKKKLETWGKPQQRFKNGEKLLDKQGKPQMTIPNVEIPSEDDLRYVFEKITGNKPPGGSNN